MITYKYLGIWIDETMKFKHQIDRTREKIKKGMKMIELLKWKKIEGWRLLYL